MKYGRDAEKRGEYMAEYDHYRRDMGRESIQKRKQLKRKYKELYEQVSEIFFRNDPVGINYETNTDEYEPEVDTIFPRLSEACSVDDVQEIIYQEFLNWFSDPGPREKYRKIAQEIWLLWEQSGGHVS